MVIYITVVAVHVDGGADMGDGHLDQSKRAAEKQASRRADRDRLRAGTLTSTELSAENDFFRNIDIGGFEIEAVGAVQVNAGTIAPEPPAKRKPATARTGRAG